MGTTYGHRIVTDGLVLHLDAANTKSYPGSGNYWYDLSGENNHPAITTLTSTTDPPGTVINLDTSTDIVTIFSESIGKYSFSFSYWGKPIEPPDWNYQSHFRFIDSVNPHGYYFIGDSRTIETPYILHYVKDFTESSWDTISMLNNTDYLTYPWNYYTLIMLAEDEWKSYFNGNLLGTNTTPGRDLSGFGDIVQFKFSRSNFYISSATIYNRALSQAEITQNFNALKGRFGL